MDRFCGSKFWDVNLTWYTEDPDLTECFQKSILIWTPCIFLWTFLSFEAYYLLHSKRRNIPVTWLYIVKFTLNLSLILLSLFDLGKSIQGIWSGITVFAVDYTTPSIKLVTFSLSLGLLHYNRKYGMRTSGLLWMFWLFLSLCGIIQFRSLLKKKDQSSYEFISYMIYFPVVVLLFLLNFLVDAEPRFSIYPLVEKPCPEQNASFPSRITFGWFDSLIWKGYKNPLEMKDLWSLNEVDTAKEIVPVFDKYWTRSLEKVNNTQEVRTQHSSNKMASVLFPLCKAFGPTFLFGVTLKVLEDITMFASPKIFELLIDFTNDAKEPMWKGYFFSFSLLFSGVFESFISAQYYKSVSLVGLRVRTALISAIYRKALRMSNIARKESTVGEIVNLMSVDAHRLMLVTSYINTIWSAPLQIVLSMYFLWKILGPSVLSGLVVMIILMPINALIAEKDRKLQVKQMENKDERIKLTNEVLNGIKVLKFYAWETSFKEQILRIRNKELKILKRIAYLEAGNRLMWSCAPLLVPLASFATFVLIDEKNVLDTKTAFVSLALFNILRFPLSILPVMISAIVQSLVSIKRLNKFMNSEELNSDSVQHDDSEENPLVIENGSFAWDLDNTENPTLRNINLQIKQGQLVAVVGIIGSGKSSLMSALLGEMEKLSGRVNTKGSIAYVPQQAWIQNATLQDNILFGKSLNENLYQKVVEVCALSSDYKMLPAGDQTEIGENGINLSGGQKQRVSLARAVYNNSDVYILDDPLSAVDSHVGKHIFDNLIGPQGLLKNKTRVLVTHGISYLPEVDNIIVLNDGEITESGTYEELMEKRGDFANFLQQHSQMKSEEANSENLIELEDNLENFTETKGFQRKTNRARSRVSISISETGSISARCLDECSVSQYSIDSQLSSHPLISNNADKRKYKIGEKLIEIEKAETGSVKWQVYSYYLKSVGWYLALLIITSFAVHHLFEISSKVWLSLWSTDNITTNGITDITKQNMYLGVYGALGFGQGFADLLISLAQAVGSILAARKIFEQFINKVLRNPMSFFDTTPSGRILSRFSEDVDIVDVELQFNLHGCIQGTFEVIAILVVITYSTPIFVTVILPVGVIYYLIQRLYIATSRQLNRLESVSRSPIYSHFGESVTGAQTIRAYGVQERFSMESENKVDYNQICHYSTIVGERWLSVRLKMLGSFIIFCSALFVVLARDNIDAGKVGLSISYALQITLSLNWLVEMTSELETNIVSLERIKEYSETPEEAAWKIDENDPPVEWPSIGSIEFQDFKVRYREGLDLVLKGVNFKVNGGEKIGIVGRTGAGKSSLTLALFRIIEAADGKILIDDVDISKIGLHTLRSRLTIIPQDPVLFSGSLRLNLDPFNKFSDDDLWKALSHAHLENFVKSLPSALSHEVSEGGGNLSVGQRQLICLARALLKKTKVLVLDEATAAVDLETDELIQTTIREEFKDCTVLTIAHRLNTILDSDRVIVLDKGSIVEYDSPKTLLQNTDSAFYSMAKDAGLT